MEETIFHMFFELISRDGISPVRSNCGVDEGGGEKERGRLSAEGRKKPVKNARVLFSTKPRQRTRRLSYQEPPAAAPIPQI